MKKHRHSSGPQSADESRKTRWWAALLVGAGLVAYGNSFGGDFVFDDGPSIVENATIRSFGQAAFPPPNITTAGRPVLNLTFALNHELSQEAVWSYHALNLLIHLLAGLVLFGVVSRTLGQPGWPGRLEPDEARPLAAGIALLWLLHPLQTESVTYVVQRAESLVGLFYLLTLYAFIRGTRAIRPWRWHAVALVACLLGMASKEVMVSAPLMVLCYDRTFVAGTFKEAWRCRRGFYLLLAASWLPLAGLVAGTEGRGGSAGFSTEISWWHYLLTQCRAVMLYLKLSFWPHPLILDYGTEVVTQAGAVWWQILALLALAGGTGWALVRKPPVGFAGGCFFAILAPSSSFVPVATQTMAEHRMYLPLAAVVALTVVGLQRWLGRWCGYVCGGLALVCLGLTWQRNADYHTKLSIWTDTVAKRPGSARAHYNLSVELEAAGRPDESVAHLNEALRLKPDYSEAHNNLGLALFKRGQRSEAMAHYEQALQSDPQSVETLNNLGQALAQPGRLDEAIAHYEQALRLRPDYPEAHNNLGEALAQTGRTAEAQARFETALRLKPDYAEAHNNLANILLAQGRRPEAIGHYEQALRAKPGLAEAHSNLAYALLQSGRLAGAIAHYEQLLRLEPGNSTAHNNLGFIAWQQGRRAEAIDHYEASLRSEPGNETAQTALAQLRSR